MLTMMRQAETFFAIAMLVFPIILQNFPHYKLVIFQRIFTPQYRNPALNDTTAVLGIQFWAAASLEFLITFGEK
jgi:hypothetical protein